MKRNYRILLSAIIVCSITLLAVPRSAAAHPMGNFTINQYSALAVGNDRVDIEYVVDMAEIPAFQELGAIRPDHNTNLTDAERQAYISKTSAALINGLTLTLDGKSLQLSVSKATVSFPPGAGGLPTLRFELYLTAPLGGATSGSLQYNSTNYTERIGWREVIAYPVSNTVFKTSSVPATDLSNALRVYKPSLINSPPVVTSASISFVPGVAPARASSGQGAAATTEQQGGISGVLNWAQQRADALTELVNQKELPLGALLIGLLIAFWMGAAHAFSPGHGKTVVAAYLVGSRGTLPQAAFLGATVTVSHTIGVFALGFVVLYASNYIVPDTLYPWLGFMSGFLIMIVGVVLFVQRMRAWKRVSSSALHTHDDHTHTHEHDDKHEHGHEHEHEHEHDHSGDPSVPHSHGPLSRPHSHLPADGQKVTLGSLLALGITGGIIPCPSALVVLLVALTSHRLGLGLLLITAFSIGLAAMLTGIGMIVVIGRNLVSQDRGGTAPGRLRGTLFAFGRSIMIRFRFSKLLQSKGLVAKLPMASALAVSCLGLLIAFQSINSR